MKRKDKHTKEYAQMIHALRRLKERYDMDLCEGEYMSLRNYIRKGKSLYPDGTEAIFVGRQSLRITLWCLIFRNRRLWAVYDKIHKTIVTFLPEEWASRNGFHDVDWKEQ